MSDNKIVGHKTFRNSDGTFRHEPLRKFEADEILAECDRKDAARKAAMPTEAHAIHAFFDAWLRLKDFGWREAIYCPKDGTEFDVIEVGSTGIHTCIYEGEWPEGTWWIVENGDMSPSRPALFRCKPSPGDEQT